MNERPTVDEADQWLRSDGQLWARTRQAPNKKGILLTVEMPWGVPYQAQVAKLSAATVTEFCDLVRGCYYARKEEQIAKKARAASERAIPDEPAVSSEVVSSIEAAVSPIDLSPENISARLHSLNEERIFLTERLAKGAREIVQLTQILEILDAPENNAEELTPLPPEEEPVSEGGSGLAQIARTEAIVLGREAGASEQDSGIPGEVDE